MRHWAAAAFAALLVTSAGFPWGGCETAAGASREAVVARTGPPTRIMRLPQGGERLQHSLPLGEQAW